MCTVSMDTFIDMSKEGHANANPTFLFCFFGGGYNVTFVVLSHDIHRYSTHNTSNICPARVENMEERQEKSMKEKILEKYKKIK